MTRLWLPEAVAKQITLTASCVAPLETGGLLIGYWSEDRASIVVVEASEAGPCAAASRSSFRPDYTHDIALVADRFERSRGRYTYLGDWHSHPGAVARLSRRDRRVLRRISRSTKARAPNPVMLIVRGGDPWEFRAWVGRGDGRFRLRWSFAAQPLVLRVFE